MAFIIQVIISVIVVYLLFSIIVYVIVEGISSLLQLRGKTLLNALDRLVGSSQLNGLLYSHPQIDKIRRDAKLPSYIPANNVAVAIIDLIKGANVAAATPGATAPATDAIFNAYKMGLSQMEPGKLKQLLQTITDHTINLEDLTKAIEKWYNEYMDRVTGWYKKKIRVVITLVAVAVTLAFNVDTIHVIKVAATDPAFRERMNNLADRVIEDSLTSVLVAEQRAKAAEPVAVDSNARLPVIDQDSLKAHIIARRAQLQALNAKVYEWDLPVGWEVKKTHPILLIVLGWAISALALSAGAPFWFDLLKRLVNLRNAGIKPSGTEASDQKK